MNMTTKALLESLVNKDAINYHTESDIKYINSNFILELDGDIFDKFEIKSNPDESAIISFSNETTNLILSSNDLVNARLYNEMTL